MRNVGVRGADRAVHKADERTQVTLNGACLVELRVVLQLQPRSLIRPVNDGHHPLEDGAGTLGTKRNYLQCATGAGDAL